MCHCTRACSVATITAKWASSPLAPFLPSLPGAAGQPVRCRVGFSVPARTPRCSLPHPPLGCGSSRGVWTCEFSWRCWGPSGFTKFALSMGGCLCRPPGPPLSRRLPPQPLRVGLLPPAGGVPWKTSWALFEPFFYVFIHITCPRVESGFLPSHVSSYCEFFGSRFSFLSPFLSPSLRFPVTKWMFIKNCLDLFRAYKTLNWHSSN